MKTPKMTPYISMIDAHKAIEFYRTVFDAKEISRLTYPDSEKVCHAELLLDDSPLMLGEEYPGMSKAPSTLGGTPVRLCLMVDDVDALVARAVQAGATVIKPVEDTFYGHRSGAVQDPFGHEWMLNQVIEKLEPAEIELRWQKMMEGK